MGFFLAVIVPVVAVLACGGVRTTIRRVYRHGDYCLGIDLTLAGLAAVIAYFVELTKRYEHKHITGDNYATANQIVVVWMIAGAILLLILVILHQVFEERLATIDRPPKKDASPTKWSFWTHPVFWLLVVANISGIIYMASFLHLVGTMP